MSNYTEKLGKLLDGIASNVSDAVQKSTSAVSSGGVKTPNRKNYSSFDDYLQDAMKAKTGKAKTDNEADSIAMPKRENYSSFDDYLQDAMQAKTGKTKANSKTNSVVMPNRKNYSNFDDYLQDAMQAKTGKKVFKNGAYNHGVTSEYITELDSNLSDFMKAQSDTLSKASFGDFSGEQSASEGIQKIRDSLQAVKDYRNESEFWLAKPTDKAKLSSALYDTSADNILKRASEVANSGSTAETLPKKQTAEDFSKVYKENRLKETTQETERDEDLVALDNTISYVEERLKAVEDAWANKHKLYNTFEGDEEMYDTAVLASKYGDLTYDEVQSYLGRLTANGPATATEYEYLTDYGIIHGFDDVESYDKAIEALKRERDQAVANYTLDSDEKYSLNGLKKYYVNGEEMVMIDRNGQSSLVSVEQAEKELREADEEVVTLDAKIATLENERDTLAAQISAWTSYAPFMNMPGYDASSRYQERTQKEMGGEYYQTYQVAKYLNSSVDEKARQREIGAIKNIDEYDEMSEEEIKMLNYLLNTRGGKTAEVYLETMMPVLQRKARKTQNAELAAYAKEHPVLGTLASFGTNVASMLAAPEQAFYGITGNDEKAYSLGEASSVTSALRSGAMQNLIEKHGWSETAAEIIYGAGTSIVDNLIAVGLSGGVRAGGADKFAQGMTQLIMSSEAASSAMTSALDRGLSSQQAALIGLGSGAIEALTEKYSIEALLSKPTSALSYFAKNTFTEGAEEIGSDVLGNMWDMMIAGNKSELLSEYNELIANGTSAKGASREVLNGTLRDMAVSFASGALAGAGSSAKPAIGFAVNTRVTGHSVNQNGDTQYIVNEALASEDKVLRSLAEKAQTQLEKKGKVSDALIGQMFMADESFADKYTSYLENKTKDNAGDVRENGNEVIFESPVAGSATTENDVDTRAAFENVAREQGTETKKLSTVNEKLSEGMSESEAIKEAASAEASPIVAARESSTENTGAQVNTQTDTTANAETNTETNTERVAINADDLAGDAKTQAQGVQNAAKSFGTTVEFYKKEAVMGKTEDGYYDRETGKLYINIRTAKPYSVVFGHELTHSTESAGTYEQLQTSVQRYLDSRAKTGEFERLALEVFNERRGTQWEVSLENARHEVVANFVSEQFFGNDEAVRGFVAFDRSAAQRVLAIIRNMMRRLTGGRLGYGTLADTERSFSEALRETRKTAAKNASKNGSAENTANASPAKESWKEVAKRLSEQYRSGEISEEEYDEQWDELIESDPEYRAETAEEARAGLGISTDAGRAENQEKRFSVSETVEEADGLIAVHNLNSEKLEDVLKLGGFPSPSIAVTGTKMTHDNYGDISVIFPRATVDPQADSRNRVYGSDAWTPTSSNARVEYRVNDDAVLSFEREINELSRGVADGIFTSSSVLRALGVENESSYTAREIAQKLASNDAVKAAYLAENGRDVEPVYRTKEYNKYGNEALQTLIDRIGVQRLAEIVSTAASGDNSLLRAEEDTVRDIIRESYEKAHEHFLNRKPEQKEARLDSYMKNNVTFFTVEDFITDAWEFFMDGGAGSSEIDRVATSDKLSEAVSREELIPWLENKLSGVIEDAGIYNGTDPYRSDGTRKSFDETHWEYTAENIVRAMANASERGETWADTYNGELLTATASPSYNTVDEMHEDSDRLRIEDDATHRETLDEISNELETVVNNILHSTKHHSDNTFDEQNIIGRIIVDAAQYAHDASSVKRAFLNEEYTVSDAQAEAVAELYERAASVPTGYFEAKPQRVVGLDEAAVYIIPNDTDPKLKGELLRRGLNMAEYDKDVAGSRQKVVNDYERYSFSVSDEVREDTVDGNWSNSSNSDELADEYKTPTDDVVEHENTQEALREKRTGGRFAGFEYATDALAAIREHMLTREEEREVAEQMLMPEVDGQQVIPYRTWLEVESLSPYQRRSDGKTMKPAGLALPIVEEDGVWLHMWDNQTGMVDDQFFPLEVLHVVAAEHSPSYAELEAMSRAAEEVANSEAIPTIETDAGLVENASGITAEDLAQWEEQEATERKRRADERRARREAREREIREENDYALQEYLATHEEEVSRAVVTLDSLSPKTRSYVNRTLAGFRQRVSRAFGIPRSRVVNASLSEISDVLVADYLQNGMISDKTRGESFEQLFEKVQRVNNDFYEEYAPLMRDLKNTHLVISREDSGDLPGGYSNFRTVASSRLSFRLAKSGEAGNVDTVYSELVSENPELFPESITHPADQLQKIFEVVREIAASRNAIETPDGTERAYMEHEYNEEVSSLASQLYAARERTLEEASDASTVKESKLSIEEEAKRVLELGREMPRLVRNMKKLSGKVLLTNHDEGVVRDLLTGNVSEEEVRRREPDADAIMQVYEARKPYEDAVAKMKLYRARVNARNRETASQLLGDVNRWHDAKGFTQIKYNIHDFTRIAHLIAPDTESAQKLIDTYVTPTKKHNAEAVRYMERMRERVAKLNLSRTVAKGDAVSESAAVQLLGEARAAQKILEAQAADDRRGKEARRRDGLTLEEWRADEAALWEANPTLAKNKAKIENAASEFEKIYSDVLTDINLALAKEALNPIEKRAGYFPHYQRVQEDSLLKKVGALLGISGRDALPTTIAGLTGDFRPNRQWFANAMSRSNNSRESQLDSVMYDAVEGFDNYIETAASLIHHTSDISRLRALETQIRYEASDDAIKREIKRIENNESLTEDEKQDAIAKRTNNARYNLSGFAQFLLEYTNKLAGKKSIIDRGVEAMFGRDVFTVVKGLTKRYAINATSSLGSAVTNFLPWAQGSNGYSTKDFARALVQVAKGTDSTNDSYFVTARQGSDKLVKTKTDKAAGIMLKPFELIDGYVSKTATQARYNKNIREGLSHETAIDEASAWAAELFADRSQGSQPLIFESSNPLVKMITQFQLEVNNQLLRTIEDMPRETRAMWQNSDNKGTAVAKIAGYWAQYALSVWLLNGVFEKAVGRGPGGDYLGIILNSIMAGLGHDDAFDELWDLIFGDDDEFEEEKEGGIFAALSSFTDNVTDEIPYVGSLLGGGRVPLASALPDFTSMPDLLSPDTSWQSKLKTLWSDYATSAMYLMLPFGASQLKKTTTGLADVIAGGAYNYDRETGEAKLKYPVAGAWDAIQATVFGSTATEGAREWTDNGFDSLDVKQTEAYKSAVASGMDEDEAKHVVQRISSYKDGQMGKSDAYTKLMYLESTDLPSDTKAVLYRDLILPSDSEDEPNAYRALLNDAESLGVTEGRLYEELVEIERIKERYDTETEDWAYDESDPFDLSDDDDGDNTKESEAIAQYLWDSDILESVKPEIWAAVSSGKTAKKLVALGMDEDEAAACEWDMANLVPIGVKSEVSAYQKARVVLEHGGSSIAAANMLAVNDRKKVAILYERGIDPEAYISMREYLLYLDDNGTVDQDEARRAINAVSKGSTTAGYGYSGRALELSKSEKAALWQCVSSSWSSEKNPFNTTVGAKVKSAIKKQGADEEEEKEEKNKAQIEKNKSAYADKYGE